MTAMFNIEYMKYLFRMTGVKLNDEHTRWSKKETFARKHVIIDAAVTTQRLIMVKSLLNKHLQSDDAKKGILFSNTAASCDTFQHNIDSWLDGNETTCGDTLLIKGLLESEWKFKAATMFTAKTESTSELLMHDRYYPRILIATASYIGACLDCLDVYCVIRNGFPTSIMHLSQ